MNILHDAFQTLQFGQSRWTRNLTVFPIRGSAAGRRASYLVLGDALSSGAAKLTEISEHGRVPEVQLANRSDRPVFLLDGEELVGCKQNRVVNLTILAPAQRAVTIPVSCVERGRWSRASDGFASSSQTLYARLRATKVADVSRTMAATGERSADQSAIWDDIGRKASRVGSLSDSGAMGGIFERRREEIADCLQCLQWTSGQVGAVFAINGSCVGFECFDCEDSCRHYLPKITAGYALDALDARPRSGVPADVATAKSFLNLIESAKYSLFPALGLGQDLRLEGSGVTGAGLVLNDAIVHLCVFDLSNLSERHPTTEQRLCYVPGNPIRRRVRH